MNSEYDSISFDGENQQIRKVIKLIDIFAGPGGLSEGFMSLKTSDGQNCFKTILSVEKDNNAHQTLKLRSFFRNFGDDVPEDYYSFLRREIDLEELYGRHPKEEEISESICWKATLGEDESLNKRIGDHVNRNVGKEDLLVLIGGPPCQAYSIIGRSRNSGNKNYVPEEDKRQLLYVEYLEILAQHSPHIFVMENVRGMVSATLKNERLFERIIGDLENPFQALEREQRDINSNGGKQGYTIYSLSEGIRLDKTKRFHSLIECELYGIPQKRHRVIFLGIRNDIEVKNFSPLRRKDPISIKSVIDDLPNVRSGISKADDGQNEWVKAIKAFNIKDYDFENDLFSKDLKKVLSEIKEKITAPEFDRGSEFIPGKYKSEYSKKWFHDKHLGGICNHTTRAHIIRDLHRYMFAACYGLSIGQSPELRDFPESLLPNHESVRNALDSGDNFSDRFRVQIADKPSTTIVSHISKDGHYYIHYDPAQCRSLTVREVARIQTFPDNYLFCGPRTQQYIQVGNAVPPLLSREIGKIVKKILDNHTDSE